MFDGGPAGGDVRSSLYVPFGRWMPLEATSRYREATDSSESGITRTPATEVMKLRSPDQRGTTWPWRCWGRPAPAASP